MLRREGPLVAVTTGAWTADEAQTMVEGIHLRSEVSFDKPMPVEFHAEVKKTYSLLESIAIFCGVGALAMVVLGLFFGGGRAAIRVMQGKPAATRAGVSADRSARAAGKRLRRTGGLKSGGSDRVAGRVCWTAMHLCRCRIGGKPLFCGG